METAEPTPTEPTATVEAPLSYEDFVRKDLAVQVKKYLGVDPYRSAEGYHRVFEASDTVPSAVDCFYWSQVTVVQRPPLLEGAGDSEVFVTTSHNFVANTLKRKVGNIPVFPHTQKRAISPIKSKGKAFPFKRRYAVLQLLGEDLDAALSTLEAACSIGMTKVKVEDVLEAVSFVGLVSPAAFSEDIFRRIAGLADGAVPVESEEEPSNLRYPLLYKLLVAGGFVYFQHSGKASPLTEEEVAAAKVRKENAEARKKAAKASAQAPAPAPAPVSAQAPARTVPAPAAVSVGASAAPVNINLTNTLSADAEKRIDDLRAELGNVRRELIGVKKEMSTLAAAMSNVQKAVTLLVTHAGIIQQKEEDAAPASTTA